MDSDNVKRIIFGVMCIALAGMSIHYDSAWCGIGSFVAFLAAID